MLAIEKNFIFLDNIRLFKINNGKYDKFITIKCKNNKPFVTSLDILLYRGLGKSTLCLPHSTKLMYK